MKIITRRRIRCKSGTEDITTCGYWAFSEPNNRGDLVIQVKPLPDWRFRLAVIGHELIEAVWCKLAGVTTEDADIFDDKCEEEFVKGTRDPMDEPGFDKNCPYRTGHRLGALWEWIVIHLTFASWKKYDEACNIAMGLTKCQSDCHQAG